MNVRRRAAGTVAAIVVLVMTFSAGAALTALGDSHDTTYYGCLYAGTLSQVGDSAPASCGRGTLISWNAVGVQGEQGEQGEQGPQGEKGLQWQGAWDAGTSYAADDAVSHAGSAWISLAADNLGNEPGTGVEWDLLAEKGDKGDTGDQGPQGNKGLQWQGAWDSGVSYAIDDAVSHAGSSWISLEADNLGNQPGTSSAWALLAQKGAEGEQGPEGSQGPAGFSGLEYNVKTEVIPIGGEGPHMVTVTAKCLGTKPVIGGGGYQDPPLGYVTYSGPVQSGFFIQNEWRVQWVVSSEDSPPEPIDTTFVAYAICANSN